MSEGAFTIATDDVCLDGHFPGRPLVPGVVILDRVIELVAEDCPESIVGVGRAKFIGALEPGVECRVTWQSGGESIRFRCHAAESTIAEGRLMCAARC